MNEPLIRLQRLYDEHGPSLLRYLRRLTGEREAAEDLLQETFVQALRASGKLEAVVCPKAWLFTIARHLGLNAIRNRKRIALLEDDQVAGPPAKEEDPRREALRRAIAELPEEHRETLQLRLRDELSYVEIAEVLKIPVGTVRSRLHVAVRKLRDLLSEE